MLLLPCPPPPPRRWEGHLASTWSPLRLPRLGDPPLPADGGWRQEPYWPLPPWPLLWPLLLSGRQGPLTASALPPSAQTAHAGSACLPGRLSSPLPTGGLPKGLHILGLVRGGLVWCSCCPGRMSPLLSGSGGGRPSGLGSHVWLSCLGALMALASLPSVSRGTVVTGGGHVGSTRKKGLATPCFSGRPLAPVETKLWVFVPFPVPVLPCGSVCGARCGQPQGKCPRESLPGTASQPRTLLICLGAVGQGGLFIFAYDTQFLCVWTFFPKIF